MTTARRPGRVPIVLQFQSAECALAALAMLMAEQGCAVPLEELRQRAGVSGEGTSLAVLKRVAQGYGFAVRAFRKEPATLAEIGFPCMAFVSFNHMLVIEAMRPDALQVVDPAQGRRTIAMAEFDRMFTGIVLRLEAGDGVRRRRPVPPAVLPALVRREWGWWLAALALALAAAAGEALAAMALAGDRPMLAPLALALVAGLGLHLALARGAQALRRRAAMLVDGLLVGRSAAYFALRSPELVTLTAGLPQVLADLAGGRAGVIMARLAGGVVPLAVLAWVEPTVAAAAALAWALCAAGLVAAWTCLRSQWRTGAPGRDHVVLAHPHTPETWQMSGGDDDAMADGLGGVAALSVAARKVAVADTALRAGMAAVTAAAVTAAALIAPGFAAPLLVLLSCRAWLSTPWLLPVWAGLPQLAGMVEDLAASPAFAAGAAPPPAGHALAVRDLSFGYGPADLLDGVDLTVPDGAVVGLTGPAGAGKSTLARLLAGVLAPRGGSVARAGTAVLVPTTPVVFAATIADNVACWRPGIGPAQIEQALRAACLWDEVAARPGGLAAQLDPAGGNLSGGQRQRLMLARALAGAPRVLILDQALDAVDRPTEARILATLRRLGMAVVLVSHRHDSLAECDIAWRLADGRCAPWQPAADTVAADAGAPAAVAPAPLPATQGIATVSDGDWAALARAAALLDIALPPRPATAPCPAFIRPLAWQARLHGMVLVPVDLHARSWWRHGAGVVLARHAGTPVVLSPSTLGGYRIHDGRVGWRRLDAATAATLDDTAHMVCRRDPAVAVPRAARWDMAAGMAGGLTLWAGMIALAHAMVPPLAEAAGAWAVVAAIGAGAGAAILARHRLQHLFGLAGAAAALGQTVRLSAWWLRRQPAHAMRRWQVDAQDQLGRRVDGGMGFWVHALAMFAAAALSPRPAAVLGAAVSAAAITACIDRACARRLRQSRPAQATTADFAADFLTVLPDCLGNPLADALLSRWRAVRDKAESLCRRSRHAHALAGLWRWVAPVAGGALAAALVSPAAAPLAALAVAAGTGCGTHAALWLDGHRRGLRLAPFLAAPCEDGGAPPAQPPAVLSAHCLSFGYDAPLLRDASLTLAPGEVVAIAGPSGCGKSTLLRLLQGFEQPQAGRVVVDGADMATLNRMAVRAHLAAVRQDEALPLRSIHGHVRGRGPAGLDGVAALLDRVGLWPRVAAMPMGLASLADTRMLSHGNAALLMLARALCHRPTVLFLDETLAGLDPRAQARAMAAIRASGAACVLTSHQPEVLALADRVLRLDGGRLVPDGAHMAPPAAPCMPAQAHREPFGAAGRLYRPAPLARLISPDISDVLPQLPPAPLALAGIAVVAGGAALLLG